ncbi:MAG TPA: YdcF family protein, partial [Pyrinomonadaceae bacterium]
MTEQLLTAHRSAFLLHRVLRWAKTKGARRSLLIAAALVAAWSVLAWVAARALIVTSVMDEHADAIVVLSGSQAYVERTRRAAELFRAGRAAKIILTNDNQRGGWSVEEQRNTLFIERAATELKRAGVPEAAIELLPQTVSSTHEEALVLREYVEAHGLRSVLVVTSAYHSRRALWTWLRVFAGSPTRI